MAYGIGLIGNRPHQMGYGAALEARDDCSIVAAAEHNAGKAAPLEERFGLPCGSDYDAVLENPNVDIVSICTDFYLKRDLVRRAVASGKHVLIDKPIARTVREAREMVEAAAGASTRISISYPLRFEAGLSLVASQIREGLHRRITSYTHRYIKYHIVSDLMAYVSYPTEARVNGGGELMNLGSHPVEYLYSLFGLPDRVYCRMENAYWEEYQAFGTEDMATLVCGYDGFTATVITGRNRGRDASPMVNMLDLNSEETWLHLNGDSVSVNGSPIDVPPVVMAPWEACVQDLIDAIEGNGEPSAGLLTGLAVAEITTAGYQSAASGQVVDLPLRDERHPLIGEDEQVIDGYLD